MSPSKHGRNSAVRSAEPYDNELFLRHVVVRIGAVVGLAVLVIVGFSELSELRGELAFMRFCQLSRLVEETRYVPTVRDAVRNASSEARLVMLFGRSSPEALRRVSMTCSRWSQNEDLDPMVRLRMAEMSVQAAFLAVRAAPSDYELWLLLARTHASLALSGQSRICLKRAQELAPPGMQFKSSQP